MDKTSLILSIIPITLTIFVVLTSTGNVWNAPDLDVQVNPNSEDAIPVDVIVRSIYNETNYLDLTADDIRGSDIDSHRSSLNIFSKNDAWVIDRIYHLNTTDGLSQKIIISNLGYEQAHDIIIQILGLDTFKIVDYSCPEIMSPEQITKEHGKKYVIVKQRLSVQLPCEFIINSVGERGVDEVIVTATNAYPAVYPQDLVDHYRFWATMFTIIGYVALVSVIYLASYILLSLYRKKAQSNPEPVYMVNEIQEMINAKFGSDVTRLIRIRDKLRKTSQLKSEDIEFLRNTTQEWDNQPKS